MIVRPHRSEDYEAARRIYTEAFRRPESPDPLPPEVPLFDALREAGDFLPELSFTAEVENAAVGHVTASKATVSTNSVVIDSIAAILAAFFSLYYEDAGQTLTVLGCSVRAGDQS